MNYGAADVTSFDSPGGAARIWYALSGSHAPLSADSAAPPAVVAAARAADAALSKFQELGFAPPLSDADSPCATNGGDAKVDIYLADFSAADGKAVSDHCLAGAVSRCSGFVIVENDFARSGYTDLTEAMNTVVPHELFHLVQNAYDAELERWWAEGSAQWAAKQLHPELRDLERFLPSFFSQPWRPLDVPASGVAADYLYATAIWPVFLSERHGVDFVRQVFDGLAAGATTTLSSVATLLEQKGTTLGEEFLWFAAYNAATGVRAQPGLGYQHAADYPLVALTPLASEPGSSADEVGSGLSAFYYSLETAEPRDLTLDTDPSRMAGLLVPLADGRAALDAALPLPAQAKTSALVVVAGQSVAKTDAPFHLGVAEAGSGTNPTGSEKLSSSCSLAHGAGLAASPGRAAFGALLGLVALVLLAVTRRSLAHRPSHETIAGSSRVARRHAMHAARFPARAFVRARRVRLRGTRRRRRFRGCRRRSHRQGR